MRISRLAALAGVTATAMLSQGAAWAQQNGGVIICDFGPCGPPNGDGQQLAAPAIIALIALGVTAAIAIAKRK